MISEPIDFLIVTALEEERDAVLDTFRELSLVPPADKDIRRYYAGDLPYSSVGGTSSAYRVALILLLDMGRVQAANATSDAIRRWNPRYVVLTGIAGGVADKGVSLGDVLVSTTVIDYELQKVKSDETVDVRYVTHQAAPRLLANVRELRGTEWHKAVSHHRPESGVPQRHLGPVASGDKVIAAREYLKSHRRVWSQLIGVEMEAAGVASACFQATRQPGFLMIKGVSDFADADKNDTATGRWRNYASIIAASFLRALLVSGPLPLSESAREAQRKSQDAEHLVEKRRKHVQSGEFDQAATCMEEAARLAGEAGDKPLQLRATRMAARDLRNQLITTRPPEREAKRIEERIGVHVDALASLGMATGALALEQALLAQLDGRPDDALRFAELAETEATDPIDVADALVVHMQAWWQKGTPELGLAFSARIEELMGQLKDADDKLVLRTNWLRTLCKGGRADGRDVQAFIGLLRDLVASQAVGSARALQSIDEVVGEFGRARPQNLEVIRDLLTLALEMAEGADDALRSANIALQLAEAEVELSQENEARRHLGIADQYVDRLASGPDNREWASKRATALVTRGRIEARLARKAEEIGSDCAIQYHRAEYEALSAAHEFVERHEAAMRGDVGPFRAEINLMLGEAAVKLGHMAEAAMHFRDARTEQVMAHPEHSRNIGMQAWMGETHAVAFSGRPAEACSLLKEFLAVPATPPKLREAAQFHLHWLEEHALQVTDWFASSAADDMRRQVAREGLRPVIAKQMRPLLTWFHDLATRNHGTAFSELFDVWGRGGFARVAWAVRCDPGNAIVVDACSIEEITNWSRVFCPLYDTVVVIWKGPLDAGLAMVPMPDNLGPPGEFGGQGYIRTSDYLDSLPGYHVAVGWGNYLPKEVSEFLATVALPLIRAGRLVVLPGALVGCTQSAVGWTDNLLVDGLFDGVVRTAGYGVAGRQGETKRPPNRVLDLGAVEIPFIDGVGLDDLNHILDDTAEWINPLRKILRKVVGGKDLRQERWDGLGCDVADIRDACHELEERWRTLARKPVASAWRVGTLTGSVSVAARPDDTSGSDSLTDLLRTVATTRPDLGLWIPYWRLRQAGGEIDWSRPLDNRSEPPDENARELGFTSPVLQGWLFPGDGGPGIVFAYVKPAPPSKSPP